MDSSNKQLMINTTLQKLFKEIDTDNDGFLTKEELIEVLIKLHLISPTTNGKNLPDDVFDNLVNYSKSIGRNEKDHFSFETFKFMIEPRLNSLKVLFDILDVDGDGEITEKELHDG